MAPGLKLDRRSFLAACITLAAGSRLVADPLKSSPLAASAQSPALLILDKRFVALGTHPRADIAFIEGDVTALWRERLDALWRNSKVTVAGVTEPAALFCLEQLARGSGRMVSMRQPIPSTNAVRWVISPVSSRGSI